LVEGDKFQAMPVNDEPGENSTAMNEKPSNALGEGNKAHAKNKAPAKKVQAKKKQVEGNLTQKKKGSKKGGENSTAMNEKPSKALGEGNKAQAKNKASAKKAQAKKKQVEGNLTQKKKGSKKGGENSTAMNEKPSNALGEGNKAQAKNKAPAKKAQTKKKQVEGNLTQKKKGSNGTKTPKATTDKTTPNKAHAEKKQVKDEAQTQMDQVLKGLNPSLPEDSGQKQEDIAQNFYKTRFFMIRRIVHEYMPVQGIQLGGIGTISKHYTKMERLYHESQALTEKTVSIGKKLCFFEEAWNMEEMKASLNSWLPSSHLTSFMTVMEYFSEYLSEREGVIHEEFVNFLLCDAEQLQKGDPSNRIPVTVWKKQDVELLLHVLQKDVDKKAEIPYTPRNNKTKNNQVGQSSQLY
jgi:hypothetical protein